MSYCKEEGKDKIVFLTPEDLQKPSTLTFPDEDEPAGLMLPNGDINWDCPCLGGMATGPCGVDFREAFSCFHYSDAEPKGSDCFESFKAMQECMSNYPTLYGNDDKPSGEEDEENEVPKEESKEPSKEDSKSEAQAKT
ncbi:mitochondrial intermembrane space import and assembly protein 40-B-like [Daphnia pulex]|uniref:CHCH domain-containing protein n=1 Tax=Daphnia pulex TaxID=6669 RepID=E9FXV9_DAPPU|nr:mitochondrial intermembrane space import and assembly protein 40-B-like [Daphnia pulex]EFX88170.1 hypothetical protein DAPPUDRAFT_305551 [Daphnia pulex]|eukprot:EFX88170.1 hypothetical protein DAPPUDRAFT_305551 [Daphnia pulex]